ncbi:pyrroline-5-carboxylate reductase [Paenibacillus sp. 1001270B_150601_E10]|uniref:pyrroline-5-carboxylate reductase n=1 Tax=Paenibacillus sp. 1001270B_150601_E10 TaxID=2787079 RepID=UPI00189D69E6|nr:pyrroline-5-carboxylate reductase [Paenibacillus sp. 1001270B_150601_E10]
MRVGFIGAGNMASAIIRGVIAQSFIDAKQVYVTDHSPDKLKAFTEETGTIACCSSEELLERVDVVVLAVKPHQFEALLQPLKGLIQSRQPLIVSIAAGLTLERIQQMIGEDAPVAIVRAMPNVNALVGASMSAIAGNAVATREQVQYLLDMFNAIGMAMELDEDSFSIFIGIAGSSPAYAYLFIDALARGALKAGMSKEKATRIAAQAVLGSAKMVLESEDAPWVLIDKVCSPGGTTIAGLCALEDAGFSSTVIKCVDATIAKDQEMLHN